MCVPYVRVLENVWYRIDWDSFVIINTKLSRQVHGEDDAARGSWSSFSIQALDLRSMLEMTLGLTLKKKM